MNFIQFSLVSRSEDAELLKREHQLTFYDALCQLEPSEKHSMDFIVSNYRKLREGSQAFS
jgi:hypothetical protein